VSQDRSTLDHLAFEIDREDYESEKDRLKGLALEVEETFFEWTGWRSIYVHDPEGNIAEFVCFDAPS